MGRKIVIVRHGERVDFTFGDAWLDKCFDGQGKYSKHNLNMPDDVIEREGLPKSYKKDCPLTQVGRLQGRLVGKGLLNQNILRPGFDIYVSPAFRSIETANAILEGMEAPADLLMKVDPCLFEWTGWYAEGIPGWATLQELIDGGFNIDTSYEPFLKTKSMTVNETVENYYRRTHELVVKLLAQSDNDILLVAHGSTLDVATRQLCGCPPRSLEEMLRVLHNVPYAGVAITEQEEDSKKWVITKPGAITMRHSAVSDFDANKTFVELK